MKRIVTIAAAALVGGALAVAEPDLPADAAKLITGKHIADSSLTGADLRDGDMSGADVRDGSLDPRSYDAAVVGPAGPAGATGSAGGPGLAGPPGVHGASYWDSELIFVPPGTWRTWSVSCPPENEAVAGGLDPVNHVSNARLAESAPSNDGSKWHIVARNTAMYEYAARAWVVCIPRDDHLPPL